MGFGKKYGWIILIALLLVALLLLWLWERNSP